jgi:hypothetical protein
LLKLALPETHQLKQVVGLLQELKKMKIDKETKPIGNICEKLAGIFKGGSDDND